ncbi:MAG: pyridoxal-phosphate-dependent aminotransferase family protein [Bacillota bacterium]
MWERQVLLLPGPTPIPPRVIQAMGEPMINHRGPAFKELLEEITEGIKTIYQTQHDVVILTTSGSGAMEAAVANFISPGEKVIVASIGSFGERFFKICKNFGVVVDYIEFPNGTAINVEEIGKRLNADKKKEVKAIFAQHNETSTGVINDIEQLSQVRGNHPALLIVDAISGLAAADLQTDAWGLDVVLSGSQKAFMIPPGLAAVSVSPRAWEAAERCTNSKFYFDLKAAKESLATGQTPYTPAISVFFGLKEALRMMLEEGLDKIFDRHRLHRDMVRAAATGLGLELLAEDSVASPSVTAIMAPAGVEVSAITGRMREKYNVVLAGGQGILKNKIFRIGHLGYVQTTDLLSAISALELVLWELGQKVKLGAGVTAAQKVLQKGGGS